MSDPHGEGVEARLRFQERSTNPYPEDDPAFDSWNGGYDEADAHAAEDDRDGGDE